MTELLAFTAENVCRMTGLSQRQLRYWDATDFFTPEILDEHRRRAFGRIYSFRDVVGLRTISLLRNTHKIPLQELRLVGGWLQSHHDTPWSALRFALAGRKVLFRDPETGSFVEPRGEGQSVIPIELELIAGDMRTAANELRDRRREDFGSLARNRYVVHNAWVVAGTRIPTSAIWNYHQAGYSADAIIREYPRLNTDDVKAAVDFESNRQAIAG